MPMLAQQTKHSMLVTDMGAAHSLALQRHQQALTVEETAALEATERHATALARRQGVAWRRGSPADRTERRGAVMLGALA